MSSVNAQIQQPLTATCSKGCIGFQTKEAHFTLPAVNIGSISSNCQHHSIVEAPISINESRLGIIGETCKASPFKKVNTVQSSPHQKIGPLGPVIDIKRFYIPLH